MEFRFNLNEIFKNCISKINSSLLPNDFAGDQRKAVNVASHVAEIVDEMGLASAKAQGLHHPITSAEKMKSSCDYTLYLMIDQEDNDGKGTVVGLLKMGVKDLFLFDATGMVHEQKTLCLLDFYVHESKQRIGYGKILFDYMLEDKCTVPCKLAIDKPSQIFLSFLFKHYGIAKIYPQNNNFVLFEGFFDEKKEIGDNSSVGSLENTYVSTHETPHDKEVREVRSEERSAVETSSSLRHEREDYLPHLYGRHTAFKLKDTMGQIIGEGSQDRDLSQDRNGE